MPIITIQTIEGVVLTSDEQKRELLKRMTDTFIDIVGELARPYTYCLIHETPLYEWALAGVPLPDLPFLYGPDYAAMHATRERADAVVRRRAVGRRRGREGTARRSPGTLGARELLPRPVELSS